MESLCQLIKWFVSNWSSEARPIIIQAIITSQQQDNFFNEERAKLASWLDG